ncbi:MAG: protoporphyrinogen oxidase HemJ [Saprospiraceae bacterium]
MLFFFKALHIIGFVAWFAGLFYLVRMFVYHVEASGKEQPERDILTRQFHLMQWRVYRIICNPGMMITWTAGLVMIFLYGWEWFTVNYWLHIKLLLLIGMVVYQLWCKRTIIKLNEGQLNISSFQFRLLNEVPTIFLVAIVMLAVYKNSLNGLYAILGLFGFGFLLFIGTKAYKRARAKNPNI